MSNIINPALEANESATLTRPPHKGRAFTQVVCKFTGGTGTARIFITPPGGDEVEFLDMTITDDGYATLEFALTQVRVEVSQAATVHVSVHDA